MTPNELRAWRHQAGLSQPGLAALLGVDPLTVSRWERGARGIPPFLSWALIGISAQQRLDVLGIGEQSRRRRRELA